MKHTILSTKTSVEVGLVDVGDDTFLCTMEKPALNLNTGVAIIKISLLGSILPKRCWILDTLDFDNGCIIFTLCHGFVKLCKSQLVSFATCWKVNHQQWNHFLCSWICHWFPALGEIIRTCSVYKTSTEKYILAVEF